MSIIAVYYFTSDYVEKPKHGHIGSGLHTPNDLRGWKYFFREHFVW